MILRVGVAAILLFLVAACGPPSQKPSFSGAAPIPSTVLGQGSSAWTWTRWQSGKGHLHFERETWQLRVNGGKIRGWLIRENRFLSTDGQPFACAQGLSYSRYARYQLQGGIVSSQIHLNEVSSKVLPSPCEDGIRPLHSYRGQLVDGVLTLDWDGGEQILIPRTIPSRLDLRELWPARLQLAGTWTWHTSERSVTSERYEQETWHIKEIAERQITATYTREVLVRSPDGQRIPCADSDAYRYTDHYSLRGQRQGNRLHLQELKVRAASHPCLEGERVLDAAEGTLYTNALVLEWRGERLQVLSRQAP